MRRRHMDWYVQTKAIKDPGQLWLKSMWLARGGCRIPVSRHPPNSPQAEQKVAFCNSQQNRPFLLRETNTLLRRIFDLSFEALFFFLSFSFSLGLER